MIIDLGYHSTDWALIGMLMLLPYLLIPLLITLLFKKQRYQQKLFTYLITTALVLLLPVIYHWVEVWNRAPAEPELHPRNCLIPFEQINLVFFLPLTLLFQFIFNAILLPKRVKVSTETTEPI